MLDQYDNGNGNCAAMTVPMTVPMMMPGGVPAAAAKARRRANFEMDAARAAAVRP
jgi:hypothetical protein